MWWLTNQDANLPLSILRLQSLRYFKQAAFFSPCWNRKRQWSRRGTHRKAPHSFCRFSFCRLDTCDICNITGRHLYQLLQLYSYFQTIRKLHIYSTDCTTTVARDIINNGFILNAQKRLKKCLLNYIWNVTPKKLLGWIDCSWSFCENINFSGYLFNWIFNLMDYEQVGI